MSILKPITVEQARKVCRLRGQLKTIDKKIRKIRDEQDHLWREAIEEYEKDRAEVIEKLKEISNR